MKVHLINARSICNKIDSLRVYVDHFKPDAVAITETWGRIPLTDYLVTPSGFSLFRKDRIDRHGGGVILLVREEFSPVSFVIPDRVNVFCDSV